MTGELVTNHLPEGYFDQPEPKTGGAGWHRPQQYLRHDPDGLDPRAKAHGGLVSVRNLDHGCRFDVRMPLSTG